MVIKIHIFFFVQKLLEKMLKESRTIRICTRVLLSHKEDGLYKQRAVLPNSIWALTPHCPVKSKDLFLTLHYFNYLGILQSDSTLLIHQMGPDFLLTWSLSSRPFVKGSEQYENEDIITPVVPVMSQIE